MSRRLSYLKITPATKQAHRIRWYGILPGGERVPRTRLMKGGDWGWDVACSCGWESHTGGAIQADVEERIDEHRWDAQP